MCSLKGAGTSGWKILVEMSPSSWVSPTGREMMLQFYYMYCRSKHGQEMMLRDGELLIEMTSGQVVCAAASFAKSTGACGGWAGTAAMSSSAGLLLSVGGNGFVEK